MLRMIFSASRTSHPRIILLRFLFAYCQMGEPTWPKNFGSRCQMKNYFQGLKAPKTISPRESDFQITENGFPLLLHSQTLVRLGFRASCSSAFTITEQWKN